MLRRNASLLCEAPCIHLPDDVLNIVLWWQMYQHTLLIRYMSDELGSHTESASQENPPVRSSAFPVIADRKEAACVAAACFHVWATAIATLERPYLSLHWHGVKHLVVDRGSWVLFTDYLDVAVDEADLRARDTRYM